LLKTAKNVKSVACAENITAYVTTDGCLYTFGRGHRGRLGDGRIDKHDVGWPQQVAKNVQSVSCGYYITAYVTTDGLLYTCGIGDDGMLGDGISDNHATGTPTMVAKNVKTVSCGHNYSAYITTDGRLCKFGADYYNEKKNHTTVIENNVKSVACGAYHFAFITTTGSLYTMGDGQWGKLGNGNIATFPRATVKPFFVSKNVESVSCGENNTAYVTTHGQLYTFGCGRYGQLGDGKTGYKHKVGRAQQVAENVKSVACGANHIGYITTDNRLYMFGGMFIDENPNPLFVAENVKSVYCAHMITAYIVNVDITEDFPFKIECGICGVNDRINQKCSECSQPMCGNSCFETHSCCKSQKMNLERSELAATRDISMGK
jgi:alpha-tubulin suppressor-like RCC1 family protein